MPKILLVHPGASYSTADVFDGLASQLEAQGCEIVHYALDSRIAFAGSWLGLAYNRARKHNPDTVKPSGADVLYKASIDVLERALRFDVDVVLVVSAMYLHPDIIVQLKRAGRRVGVVLTESPYDDLPQARVVKHVDIAWTNERSSLPYLRQVNPHVYYLPHAHDPAKHNTTLSAPDNTAMHDVVFVGTGFQERCDVLRGVDWDGIDLGLYGEWGLFGSRSRIRRHIRGGVMDNALAVNLYQRAKIGLNLYRTSRGFGRHAPRIEHAESLNPRALELAACGAFTISDHRPEVGEVFGDLVPTFADAAGLESSIRFYLAHDAERQRIAAALPAAVAGHTYAARAAQIISDLARVGMGSDVALAI